MAGDVKVAVVSGVISTGAAGTADFTKAGFGTPKACIILLSFDPTDNTAVQSESKVSIGFSDFTKQLCITHQDENASAKVDCDSRKSATKAYVGLGTGGAVFVDGTASAITDGVRLTNTSSTLISGIFATVIMFGGVDLKISVDSTTIGSAQDTSVTITPGAGFDTSLIFFIGVDIAGEDSSSSGINNSFGVCHINAPTFTVKTQRCMGWASDHNNAVGSPHSVIRNNRCLSQITEAGVQDWGLEVGSVATNSINIITRDAGAGAGMEVYSLALDIDDRIAKVGSVDSPTSGASWTPSVALGFIPQYVGLGLTRLPSENVIDSSPAAGVHGISSNTGAAEETCHSWYNDDGGATTDTNNLFRSRAVDLRQDDAAAVKFDFTHSSFNDGDWTYTIVSEDVTAAEKWFYFAIEEAAAGGQSLAIGTSSESDSALGLGLGLGLSAALETDISLGLGLGLGISLAAESDASIALARAELLAVTVAPETDVALSLGLGLGINQALETDTAIPVTVGGLSAAIATALETDSALAVARAVGIGLALETDLAFRLALALGVGAAGETDTALVLTRGEAVGIGLAIEPDIALPLGLGLGIEASLETDTALPVSIGGSSALIGIALEVDSASPFGLALGIDLGSETDAALALTAVEVVPILLAAETDSSFPFGAILALGSALETDLSIALTRAEAQAVALASETDAALRLALGLDIGAALETDAALAFTSAQSRLIGIALETDLALAVVVGGQLVFVDGVGKVWLARPRGRDWASRPRGRDWAARPRGRDWETRE